MLSPTNVRSSHNSGDGSFASKRKTSVDARNEAAQEMNEIEAEKLSQARSKSIRKANPKQLQPLVNYSAPDFPSEALLVQQDSGTPEDTVTIVRR